MKVKTIVYAGLLAGIQTVCAAIWAPVDLDGLSSVSGNGIDSAKQDILFNPASVMPLLTFTNDSLMNSAVEDLQASIIPGWPSLVIQEANSLQLDGFGKGKWIKVQHIGTFAGQVHWKLVFQNGDEVLVAEMLALPKPSVAGKSDTPQSKISTVPLSATAWIFLSGLMGFLALSKNKQRRQTTD